MAKHLETVQKPLATLLPNPEQRGRRMDSVLAYLKTDESKRAGQLCVCCSFKFTCEYWVRERKGKGKKKGEKDVAG